MNRIQQQRAALEAITAQRGLFMWVGTHDQWADWGTRGGLLEILAGPRVPRSLWTCCVDTVVLSWSTPRWVIQRQVANSQNPEVQLYSTTLSGDTDVRTAKVADRLVSWTSSGRVCSFVLLAPRIDTSDTNSVTTAKLEWWRAALTVYVRSHRAAQEHSFEVRYAAVFELHGMLLQSLRENCPGYTTMMSMCCHYCVESSSRRHCWPKLLELRFSNSRSKGFFCKKLRGSLLRRNAVEGPLSEWAIESLVYHSHGATRDADTSV